MPAPLRQRWMVMRLPERLYGTALLAWTLGLALATYGLLHNAGARSDGAAAPIDASRSEPAEPPHP